MTTSKIRASGAACRCHRQRPYSRALPADAVLWVPGPPRKRIDLIQRACSRMEQIPLRCQSDSGKVLIYREIISGMGFAR